MNTAPALSEQDLARLRAYVGASQSGRWRRWSDFALYAFLSLGLFAVGQWLSRWFPGHLTGRGLALCQSHQTLHRGVVWWPSETLDLNTLLKGPAGGLMLCGYFIGMMALIVWAHQAKARQVAVILTRLHPELAVAP